MTFKLRPEGTGGIEAEGLGWLEPQGRVRGAAHGVTWERWLGGVRTTSELGLQVPDERTKAGDRTD